MRRLCFAVGLLLACDDGGDAPMRDASVDGRIDAPLDAHVDARADTASQDECIAAYADYRALQAGDDALQQLAACSRDEDCVLYTAADTCVNGTRLGDCPIATGRANSAQALALTQSLLESVCARMSGSCNAGPKCATRVARCVEQRCAITTPDAGR